MVSLLQLIIWISPVSAGGRNVQIHIVFDRCESDADIRIYHSTLVGVQFPAVQILAGGHLESDFHSCRDDPSVLFEHVFRCDEGISDTRIEKSCIPGHAHSEISHYLMILFEHRAESNGEVQVIHIQR